MPRLNSFCGILSFLFLISVLNACGADPTGATALELEALKNQEKGKLVSEGAVTKREVAGRYQYHPFGYAAFDLNSEGTGVMHGGTRNSGNWRLMWDFDEKNQTFSIQTDQFKRVFKAIKKDGKVWMIDGREVWRQGANFNAPIPNNRDIAYQR